jgi:hypothetical protein
MAAARARCTNCGEPFDRRQVTQAYCFKPDCRRARNRDRIAEWRRVRRVLDEAHIARIRQAVA